jgi:drug/metabolite transporter (DMT)-like permease
MTSGQPLRRDRLDTFGVVGLTGFALLLAFNQVVIKVTNGGLQPVFFAGLRSAGAIICIALWCYARGISVRGDARVALAGVITGTIFAVEFLLLFVALDLTTVSRTAVIFYSMPVWMAILAHLFVPGDRLTGTRVAGLALCMAGVALAMTQRSGGEASLWGDLAALGAAWGWAATALMAKASPLRRVPPEGQLLWQVGVSAPILLLLAPLFGPLLRDPGLIHWAGLAFQIVIVVSAGFIFWLWLLARYPASGVASFSFLSPVFGVALGWLMLGEDLHWTLVAALVLVAAGLLAINRRPAGPPPAPKP